MGRSAFVIGKGIEASYTIFGVARELFVSESTVRRWIKQKKLDANFDGKRWLIPHSSLYSMMTNKNVNKREWNRNCKYFIRYNYHILHSDVESLDELNARLDMLSNKVI